MKFFFHFSIIVSIFCIGCKESNAREKEIGASTSQAMSPTAENLSGQVQNFEPSENSIDSDTDAAQVNHVKENEVDGDVVADVMSFLNTQKFELELESKESEVQVSNISGPLKKERDDTKAFVYTDFKYNAEKKALEWRSITTSGWAMRQRNDQYPQFNSDTARDYGLEYAYRMPLKNFTGSFKVSSKKIGDQEYTTLTLPVEAEAMVGESEDWEGTTVDILTKAWFFRAYLQSTDNQGKPSERSTKLMKKFQNTDPQSNTKVEDLGLETHKEIEFNVTNNLAPRLKLALEDLFKAHGAKVSKY
jgi:hypothetical protein